MAPTKEQCMLCRFYEEKCTHPEAKGLIITGDCTFFIRRWPHGLKIPQFED